MFTTTQHPDVRLGRPGHPATDLRFKVDQAMTSAPSPTTPTTRATPVRDNPAATSRRTARPTLSGGITLTYNRTSSPATKDIDGGPTEPDRVALVAAEQLIHDLLAIGMPADLATRHEVMTYVAEKTFPAYAGQGMNRRGPVLAEGAAVHHLMWCQPANLTFAFRGHLRAWHQTQVADLPAELQPDPASRQFAAARRVYGRDRLVWTAGDDKATIGTGLLLDRLHNTHLDGLIDRDTWTRRKVAADLDSIANLLATAEGHRDHTSVIDRVLGVRVLSHLAPNAGRHFTATLAQGRVALGPSHGIGECDRCATGSYLPNLARTTGNARARQQVQR